MSTIDFVREYASLSDEEFAAIDPAELMPEARAAYSAEQVT